MSSSATAACAGSWAGAAARSSASRGDARARAGGAGIAAELPPPGRDDVGRADLGRRRAAGKSRRGGTRAPTARDRVVVITRLRLASGKPLAIERSSLPARLFPDIEDMDLGSSLLELMAGRSASVPSDRSSGSSSWTRGRRDMRALGVRRDAPLLLVERIRYAADGTPVEFARDRFRPDRTRVVLESTEVGE